MVSIKKHSNLRFKGTSIYFDPQNGEADGKIKFALPRHNQREVTNCQTYNRSGMAPN